MSRLLPLPLPVPDGTGRESRPALTEANAAAAHAREVRARALVDIDQGALTIEKLLDRARTPDGAVYQRVTLTQLLRAAGHSEGSVRRVLEHTLRTLGDNPGTPRRSLTVSWLLDGRSRGRRIAALQDALAPRDKPWAGYPWAPDPAPNRPLGLRATGDGTLL
ncbi:MAG: hypothetical protein ACTH0V_00220 [Microbacteriaceae bacterium]